MKNKTLLLPGLALLALTACVGDAPHLDNGQYWQRVNMSDAIYAQGPKAQQMLNRDISRCVTELRELERLGTIKNAIPTDFEGRVLDPDEKAMNDWDTPERDQHLLAEHGDYHDFESCMLDKGWERVKHVPYDVAERAEDNYYAANVRYSKPMRAEEEQESTTHTPNSNNSGDYGHFNQ